VKRNRYSRALKHLKSTEIEEKIQRLNEAPTNNIGGVYSLNQPGFRLGGIEEQDPERIFYPDVDGNWPAGIPGDPNSLTYTRPRGYWDSGPGTVPAVQTTVDASANFTTLSGQNGTNTDGLIRPSDGYVKADLPPNTRNFILGPLVDGYVMNHGISVYSPNGSDYTNIGYIQKDTRQFVLLGRIKGTWGEITRGDVNIGFGLYKSYIWKGTADEFTSYNPDFTLEHALWFRDKVLSGKFTKAVPYKYSGGYPQPPDPVNPGFYNGNLPDDGKRGGKNDNRGNPQNPASKGGPDPNLVPRSALPKKKKTALPKKKKNQDLYLNVLGRKVRSVTDPIRYSGTKMYQGNPAGRTPGLSPFWTPDPRTAGTYTRGGSLKGIPGASPSSSGTLSTAERVSGVKVERSVLGQPQFVLPRGVIAGEITTQQATRLATDAAASEAKAGSKILGRAVPLLSIGLAVADAGIRISQGDYVGAALSGLSAIPGPLGWAALGVQVGYDLYGSTKKEDVDLTKEKQIQIAGEVIKKNNIDINPSAYIRNLITMLNAENLTKKENEIIQKMIFNEKIKKEDEKIFFSAIDKLNKKYKNERTDKTIEISSFNPQGELLSESRKKIARDIKKPVVVKEPAVEKLKKYRPNFAGRYTPQNTPDVTASSQSDEIVKAKNAAGQTWRTYDKHWARYESTERMNIIYDNIGHGSQYWDMIENHNQNRKVKRDREIQEQLNIIAHEKAMLKENPLYESPFRKALEEQETLQADKDPLFKKVSKRLKKEIDYPDKPSKAGYPNDSPPEMVNGWHPEYGKDKGYYNKLDPYSAESMPTTGNPQIDANVRRANTLKKVLGKRA